ncbi:hypothetical protein FD25_GL000953 [Levilactobacillus acidifarinae DSM 19394]|uniref:Surface layer protein A domain-containing protein n=2 Tax=Levilactobacillus acidifarinae TaxID=267364 RepID=A0A0R1LEW9_9LACO|nr:hypothetical protein FD25_GL000953 [Levilactobacillus acidifarinae DSM 19394]
MGLALTVAGAPNTANAASKTKVISVTKVARQAYHGKKGNVYKTAKLSKVAYRLNKTKSTTWYVTKQAVVKKHGKKVQVKYVQNKAKTKKGWVYSSNLKAGKANNFNNDSTAVGRYVSTGSVTLQRAYNSANGTYGNLGFSIGSAWNYDGYANPDKLKDVIKDQKALVNLYRSTFKNRFSKTQNTLLSATANELAAVKATEGNKDLIISKMETFSDMLGTQVSQLS